ncbi:hypothetical protein DPMN_108098 [Dreissena polymorpha]|uniref:Uncharacterized protein n=1 Tax=Dreissena polymorpha TaxID=45954 RepID=A0A9D4QKK0_DREPO|nr:hypothetical protein DPMN_108098 [Dreissena polymorpha]
MPLTSGTTCHRDASHIGHNALQRFLSHRTQLDTDIQIVAGTMCHRAVLHIKHNVKRRCHSH